MRIHRYLARTILLAALISAIGCARGDRKLHPVKGRVTLPGGDVKVLAGSFVEAALINDPTVRASGVIQSDGTFTLETVVEGYMSRGVTAGRYQVRIVAANDDSEKQRQVEAALPVRCRDFGLSGVEFNVPTTSEVVIACTE